MKSLLDLLFRYWQSKAFRPLQEEVITNYLKGKDTVVLMPTGGGKSVCYQLPALLDKDQTLVISPLISLMQDQVDQLNDKGIKSMYFESHQDKNDIYRQLENARNGGFKLIYCSPERLVNEGFLQQIKKLSIKGIAIDEAHCISEWGHDFRPAFKSIKKLRTLFPSVPFMALTATATPKVLDSIIEDLELDRPKVFKNSFERKNIRYHIQPTEDKMGALKKIICKKEVAIIYCRSRSKTESIARQLQLWGIKANFYHGGLEVSLKKQRLEEWRREKNPVMVATNAFGMGIDKANVRKVIHLIMPESMESYYQETGRAGRDGLSSEGILLVHPSDKDRMKTQFLSHLPDKKYVKKFFKKLCDSLQMAYGEGEGEEYKLSFKDFCDTYGLHAKKAYQCMSLLDREGVFEMQQVHETQSYLKIICEPAIAKQRIEKGDDTARVLQFLMRNYEEIFRREKKINWGQLVDLVGIPFEEIPKKLELLTRENIIDHQQSKTDIKLYWKVPREDQYTLNPFLKRMTAHHRFKADKIKFMIDYAFDSSQCKRNQVLMYFGEKKTDYCYQCSGDCCQKDSEVDSGLRQKILKLLQSEALSAYQIGLNLGTSNEFIVIALHQMLEENIVGINSSNQFYLK